MTRTQANRSRLPGRGDRCGLGAVAGALLTAAGSSAASGRFGRRGTGVRAFRTIGTVLRWHGEERYGYVVLQPDLEGTWRAIESNDGLFSLDAAATEVLSKIRHLTVSGEASAS
jgi:hypothetical protein